MQFLSKSGMHRTAPIATVVALVCGFPIFSACAQQTAQGNTAPVSPQALEAWHATIKKTPPPTQGCFHATYPSQEWQHVSCGPAPGFRSATRPHHKGATAEALGTRQTAGNGTDYVAQPASLTTSAVGSFPSVSGLTSEKGVGVAAYGGGGVLGANQYTLQLNSDINPSATACGAFGYSSCDVWEQFVYSTADGTGAPAQVFIQNWVFPSTSDYDNSGCPSGWEDASSTGSPACVVNSSATNVPAVGATQLGQLKLSGSVSSNGNDVVVFTDGSDAYSASEPDSTVSLASWWSQSEFNVVGNGGGSEAQFNSGTALTVQLGVSDGSGTGAPSCIGPSGAGTTGESNNLNLGQCTAAGGSSPYIQFTESN